MDKSLLTFRRGYHREGCGFFSYVHSLPPDGVGGVVQVEILVLSYYELERRLTLKTVKTRN